MTLRKRLGLWLLEVRPPEPHEELVFDYRKPIWVESLERHVRPGEKPEDVLLEAMRAIPVPEGYSLPWWHKENLPADNCAHNEVNFYFDVDTNTLRCRCENQSFKVPKRDAAWWAQRFDAK